MEELSEKIDRFVTKFKKNKSFYFAGRGFITFRNYKFAYIFKHINDKMLQKDFAITYDQVQNIKPRKRF